MSAIKVYFEIGHEASVRSKKTPEGFTHDWEVFVRGQEGAEICHFVEKVVFHLHETFPRPKRVVKEPPFSVKESGYAGFLFPIEIYLKNKDEPKKIKFSYDLTLQQSGFLKDRFIFEKPNDDFRKKLLKGGGIPVSNNAYYTNPDQESRSRDSFSDEKQLVSKPKLSSENIKKHKTKEHKEEIPHRASSFENLFGATLQKPSKVSPDPKKILEKTANNVTAKSDKRDKERSNSDKKSKEQKDTKSEKSKSKEDKDKNRSEKSEKVKSHKDQEKVKEKPNKRPNERPPSPPDNSKKRCPSPNKRPPSPPPRSSSATSVKEDYKQSKHNTDNIEQKKSKIEEKQSEVKVDRDQKEKKKKEKKSHDRDKERKEKKEHKKESHKQKESPKEPVKEVPKEATKPKETPKEKESRKESPPMKEKQKPEKVINKLSIDNFRKTPPPEIEERTENHKTKEKGDSERKRNKHKKKDKKREESREKHKEHSKDKKHKHDKAMLFEKQETIERRPTPIPKERLIAESASPISIDTASQCSSKSGLIKTSHTGAEDINSNSDSENSIIAEEDEVKIKVENPTPEPVKREPSPEPEPEPEPEVEPVVEPPAQPKEKTKKHKDKSSKKEEKRRKRKAAEEEDAESRKLAKMAESGPSNTDSERGETSGCGSAETKVQDNGVSSSLGEDAEPGDLSPDYMVQLRELQQRIMTINNDEDLERVVNLIAETGRYEVTTQTFDFDLCLLDRSTVQQLIQLVGC